MIFIGRSKNLPDVGLVVSFAYVSIMLGMTVLYVIFKH